VTTWKRKKVLCGVIAMVLAIAGVLVAGCGTLRMSFVDFPIHELTLLDTSAPGTPRTSDAGANSGVAPVAAGLITGEGACSLRSSLTGITGRFLPGHTFVDVLINGTKCTLLVDTGCPTTTLSPRLAKRAHVPIAKAPSGTWEQADGQGSTPVYPGLATSLVVGNFTISNVPVKVLGKQHEVRILGVPVYHLDGLLGMDILQHFAITFVLADASVRFSRDVPPPAPQAKRLSFRLSRTRIISQATVNGQLIGDCLVDTGSSGRLLLPEATWSKLALGETPARVAFQMGDVIMNEVVAERSNALDMGMVPMNILATKGTKTITLDFRAQQIIFE